MASAAVTDAREPLPAQQATSPADMPFAGLRANLPCCEQWSTDGYAHLLTRRASSAACKGESESLAVACDAAASLACVAAALQSLPAVSPSPEPMLVMTLLEPRLSALAAPSLPLPLAGSAPVTALQ